MSLIVKPPFIYEAIKVTHQAVQVSHQKEVLTFTASGRKIIQAGWKDQQPDDEEQEEKEEAQDLQEIPDLKEGDSLSLTDPRITSHERKPPKSFTEASILTAMKKHGLGTPATRDTIIESLVKNEYCFRKGKQFLPAQKAFSFINAIPEELELYLKVDTTGVWESMLENEPEKFFADIKLSLVDTITAIKSKDFNTFLNSVGTCPKCGGALRSGKFSYYCIDKNCKFSISKSICEAAITEADIKSLLAGKPTGLKSMKSKNGKDFKARLKLDKDFKVQFEFPDSNKEAKK